MEQQIGTIQQRKLLKESYGFEFPKEYWTFLKFYQEINGTAKQKTLEDIEGLGLFPTGPLDVLKGVFAEREPKLPVTHHMRFRMDPPEFFTILLGRDDGLHFGYWVDDIRDGDICIAGYYNNDAFVIDYYGTSLFEFIRYELESMVSAYMEDLESQNEEDIRYTKKILRRLAGLRNILMKYGTGERKLKGEEYCIYYAEEDNRRWTAPTWDGMGIIVPEGTYQYWEEKYFDGYLKPSAHGEDFDSEDVTRLCRQAEVFLEQGFYGNALQIGKNLWSFGMRYSEEATKILEKAYLGLGRDNYAELIHIHQTHRNRLCADISDYKGY